MMCFVPSPLTITDPGMQRDAFQVESSGGRMSLFEGVIFPLSIPFLNNLIYGRFLKNNNNNK